MSHQATRSATSNAILFRIELSTAQRTPRYRLCPTRRSTASAHVPRDLTGHSIGMRPLPPIPEDLWCELRCYRRFIERYALTVRFGSRAEGKAKPIAILEAWNDLFVPFQAAIRNQVHNISVLGQYLRDARTRVPRIRFEDDTRTNRFKQSPRPAQNGI